MSQLRLCLLLILFCLSVCVCSLSPSPQHSSQVSSTSAGFESTNSPSITLVPAMPPPDQQSKTVLKLTIIATASITLAIAFVLFFCRKIARRLRQVSSFHGEERIPSFDMFGKRVNGLIMDENGQAILYMRNSNEQQLKTVFPKIIFNPSYEHEQEEEEKRKDAMIERLIKSEAFKASSENSRVISQLSENTIENLKSKQDASMPSVSCLPPPPPPPPPMKKNVLPAPKPLKPGSIMVSSLKPPAAPKKSSSQTKLKALYWDKVTTICDHSLVWNEVKDGSLRLDDGLMETLFGYTVTNRKSLERVDISSSSGVSNSSQTAKVFILDPRKSQNTAIVLRSIEISRKEIVDALLEGGLSTDILEKLTKIAPTQEEESRILQYKNDPMKLADAENFIYYILKAFPSAFIRIKAMHFRSNYDQEVVHLKESIQTLEIACKELRTRGLFLKLLEAILKVGNRMNAGTPRGNAQGFNLSALRKLSDVKSTNGKTTLLHFVVEQVGWSEGRRSVMNQDLNVALQTTEERNKEYLNLGLHALKGLTTVELSNVKKAASIQYDDFINVCSKLKRSVGDIQQLVNNRCSSDNERGGFVSKTREFFEECEAEVKVVEEELKRVVQILKRTRQYYQAGDHEENPLQLFVIVKDFLDMVDRVQVEIHKKQDKKIVLTGAGLSPPLSPAAEIQLRFQNFRTQFVSDISRTASSSESDEDF